MARTSLNFGAQVDGWVKKVEGLESAVFRVATQSLFEQVKTGTPVDTGTLRNSFIATVNQPLQARPIKAAVGALSETSITASIGGAKIGDTIYGTFVANYAVHVEYGTSKMAGRGMVRLAAQNWQQHVNAAIAKARARFPASGG